MTSTTSTTTSTTTESSPVISPGGLPSFQLRPPIPSDLDLTVKFCLTAISKKSVSEGIITRMEKMLNAILKTSVRSEAGIVFSYNKQDIVTLKVRKSFFRKDYDKDTIVFQLKHFRINTENGELIFSLRKYEELPYEYKLRRLILTFGGAGHLWDKILSQRTYPLSRKEMEVEFPEKEMNEFMIEKEIADPVWFWWEGGKFKILVECGWISEDGTREDPMDYFMQSEKSHEITLEDVYEGEIFKLKLVLEKIFDLKSGKETEVEAPEIPEMVLNNM